MSIRITTAKMMAAAPATTGPAAAISAAMAGNAGAKAPNAVAAAGPVSYTHLDVYKRQISCSIRKSTVGPLTTIPKREEK